jgi:hypothetical protein
MSCPSVSCRGPAAAEHILSPDLHLPDSPSLTMAGYSSLASSFRQVKVFTATASPWRATSLQVQHCHAFACRASQDPQGFDFSQQAFTASQHSLHDGQLSLLRGSQAASTQVYSAACSSDTALHQPHQQRAGTGSSMAGPATSKVLRCRGCGYQIVMNLEWLYHSLCTTRLLHAQTHDHAAVPRMQLAPRFRQSRTAGTASMRHASALRQPSVSPWHFASLGRRQPQRGVRRLLPINDGLPSTPHLVCQTMLITLGACTDSQSATNAKASVVCDMH